MIKQKKSQERGLNNISHYETLCMLPYFRNHMYETDVTVKHPLAHSTSEGILTDPRHFQHNYYLHAEIQTIHNLKPIILSILLLLILLVTEKQV